MQTKFEQCLTVLVHSDSLQEIIQIPQGFKKNDDFALALGTEQEQIKPPANLRQENS